MTHGTLNLAAIGFIAPVLLWCASCSVKDGDLGSLQQGGNAVAGSSGAGNSLCLPTSPAVTVAGPAGTAPYETCSSRIATSHFISALCTCGDAKVGEFLMTGGFDSALGGNQTGPVDDGGAAVGINGNFSAVGYTDIGGSFTVAGSDSVRFVGQLLVRGDFRANGSVNVTGSTAVSRDVWLGSSFVGLGPLNVAGALHHTGTVSALPVRAATQSEEAVTTPLPCACGSNELLDVANLVGGARTNNDNQRLSVDSNLLAQVNGTVDVTLPCGRIYLTQVNGSGNVTVNVTGKLALFIDGSLELTGSLVFRLSAGAEVDVFVAANVAVTDKLTISTKERPAAGRLYVGGNGDIALPSPWIGNLYAPRNQITAKVAFEAWGSIFCREFVATSSASIVFDRAIVDSGSTCESTSPIGTCVQCGWCADGTACVAGTCGACQKDMDCCGQAVCVSGSCGPLVIM